MNDMKAIPFLLIIILILLAGCTFIKEPGKQTDTNKIPDVFPDNPITPYPTTDNTGIQIPTDSKGKDDNFPTDDSNSLDTTIIPEPTPVINTDQNNPLPPVEELTLRQLADKRNLLFGALLERDYFSDPDYLRIHNENYNVAVAGEEFKMTKIGKKGRDQFEFGEADSVVTQAQENNQKIHAHVLVYHNAIPSWLSVGNYSKDEMMEILENYTRTVVRHFKGKINTWDVTNELWDAQTGDWKNKLFYNTLGEDYPKYVFQWAREEDPNAELILNGNEYQLPGPGLNTALSTIQQWKNEGVPIDGIGLQLHSRLDVVESIGYSTVVDGFKQSLQAFSDLGLNIHITELDIAIDLPVTQEKLDLQARLYRDIIDACLAQPKCIEINTWGFTDKYSWINTHPVYEGKYAAGLPFDEFYQPKPSYFEIQNALK